MGAAAYAAKLRVDLGCVPIERPSVILDDRWCNRPPGARRYPGLACALRCACQLWASMKTRVISGNACLMRRSISEIAASTCDDESVYEKSRLTVTSTSSGPKCSVSSSLTRSIPGRWAMIRSMPADDLGPRRLADQEPLALVGEDRGGQGQDHADDDRSGGVHPHQIERLSERDRGEGDDEAEHRRGVLEQHGEDGRVLALRTASR